MEHLAHSLRVSLLLSAQVTFLPPSLPPPPSPFTHHSAGGHGELIGGVRVV